MKAVSLYFFTFLLSLTLCPLIANGPTGYPEEPGEEDYITYYKEGKLVIKKYIGESASITIPYYIQNTVVCEIEKDAFYGILTLKQVNIPAGIRKIGDNAFKHCDSLESVIFQSSELSIGNAAFSECSNLKEIIIPEGTDTIGSYAFSNCKKLSKVTVLDADVVFVLDADTCNIFNKNRGEVDNIFIGYDGSTTELLAEKMSYSFSTIRENTTTTAIETNKFMSLSIYPTVIDKSQNMYLNIKTNSSDNDGELSIYSTNGKLILKQKTRQSFIRINLANTSISKGIYVVTLSSDAGRQANKFIVR